MKLKVLVTGGSGYLGQFLIERLCKTDCVVAYTYLSNPLVNGHVNAEPFKVDLATGDGLKGAVHGFKPNVVINCAAISQPAACERDYEACKALNVPKKLVAALEQLKKHDGIEALLVHISTDQVYAGTRPNWREADPTEPVNAYGRSKLEAEQHLQQAWPGRYVVLRASLIYGPEPPLSPVGRPLFVQFVEQVLAKGQETSFFVDEYRSAVYVQDICDTVQHIISSYAAAAEHTAAHKAAAASPGGCTLAQLPHSVYNMGGTERLSRHDMAMAVAQHCGHSSAAITEAKSADVQRGYNSPPDISMDMEQFLSDMPGMKLTPFQEGLQHIFPTAQ